MSTEPTPENLRQCVGPIMPTDIDGKPIATFALLLNAADRIEKLEAALDQANRLLDAIADDLSVDMDDYIDALGGESDG